MTILNIKEFLKYPWNNYLKEINEYAGDYKYRWGDTDVIGIFAYTFFDNTIHNYDLVNRGYYLAERKNSGLAPDPDSYLNYYSENFLIKSLKKIYSYYKK